MSVCACMCVCKCARACVYVCMCVCVYVYLCRFDSGVVVVCDGLVVKLDIIFVGVLVI